jgi:preprotein translocase subunit SecA
MYPKLAGMTGTAMTEAPELKDIYNIDVVAVPTHHTIQRKDHDDEIYGTRKYKYNAIVKQIQESNSKGQPVLVGTISIEKSEEISALLKTQN